MKKLITIAAIALATWITSCDKGDPNGNPDDGRFIVKAGVSSRVGINDTDVTWRKADRIQLFYSADQKAASRAGTFTLLDEHDGQSSGSFAGDISEGAGAGTYYAVHGWMSGGTSAFTAPDASSTGINIEMNQVQKGASDPASVGLYSRFWADPVTVEAAPQSKELNFTFRPLTCVLDIAVKNINAGQKVKSVTLKGEMGDPSSELSGRTYPFMARWQLNKSSGGGNLSFGVVASSDYYRPGMRVSLQPAMSSDFTASIVAFPRDMPSMVALTDEGGNGAQDTPRELSITVTVENAQGVEQTYTVRNISVPMHTYVPGGRYKVGEFDFTGLTADIPPGGIPLSPPGGTPDPDRDEVGKENGIRYPYGTGTNQWLLFYPAVGASGPAPVYLWAHPNGQSAVNPTQTARSFGGNTIATCNEAGIAVISWESEPQVQSMAHVATCQADLINVYNWMNQYANDLNIDMNNIFIGGASRGTIVSWNFVCTQYSKVRGVYMIQALPVSAWSKPNGTYEQNTGNDVVKWITVNNPPTYFNYKDGMDTDDNHHPKFGYWIKQRYTELGIGDRMTVVDSNKSNYNNLVSFIQSNLQP